jgi:hypothetical protein
MPVSEAMDRHVRSRQIALARSMQHRKKIYLDTCFWISARKAVLDSAATAEERKLLHLLRRGVRARQWICPISESTFIEVMKQSDATTRVATAALIDELSLGVSLTSGRTRTATEIAHFFRTATGENDLYAMQELVWTKLSYALGYLHPTVAECDADAELRMQMEVFDAIWESPLIAIAEKVAPPEMREAGGLRESAATIDADIKTHQPNLVSFAQTYRDEIVGAADNYHPMLIDVIAQKAERAGLPPPSTDTPQSRENARIARNILVAVFEKPETRKTLRSMHIQACLHAGLRWNKGTRFVANHFFDFEHATAALAYCDAFFTEGFLANLINARHMKLGDLNNCRTTNKMDEALGILRSLSNAPIAIQEGAPA